MAKTALLAQNDNLAIDQIKQSVGRSVFDLSHSTTFPIDVDGAILPICAIETVPSDSFEISVECLLRQLSPLKVPVMTNLRLNTAFYWCDNRLAWKKWDRFIEGGRSGNEVYEIPRMANRAFYKSENDDKYDLVDTNSQSSAVASSDGYNQSLKNTLHTYLGISLNHNHDGTETYDTATDYSDELPVAFPFFDYQLICRDNYTDIDRLADSDSGKQNFENPFSDWTYSNIFPVDDDEIKLKDGPQMYSGYHSDDDSSGVTPGIVLDKVRYHNVRDDYFTTSKKAPMRGNAPAISLVAASSALDFTDAVAKPGDLLEQTESLAANQLKLFTSATDPETSVPRTDVLGYENVSHVADSNNPYLLNALNKGTVNITLNSNVTYAEILLLSQLTIWQTLNMLHEPFYDDFLNAHFNGVSVGETAVEKPIYIGGTSQIIHINEIEQTSASTETSSLGTVGATAHSLENNFVGKIYCNSYGWLIGVVYIQPDMVYNPAMPRSYSRRTKEDFYFPEFANLSMQAILNKEIFFSNSDEWNNTPWGYTGCFDEMRSIPNRVAGDLLNSSYTDLKAWVLRREFDNSNKPAMSTSFLSLKGNVDKTAWQVPEMPAFMLQCANYIKAVRPMPYVAIPKAI